MNAYGWRAQKPDHRDLSYNAEERILLSHQLPVKYDLWDQRLCPPIWDQQQEGSCTAHGSTRAACVTLIRERVVLPPPPAGGAPFSRNAQYYWTRALEGTTTQDAGGTVRDAVKVIATTGMAPEELWPYEQGNMFTAPPASVQAAAKPNIAVKYQAVTVGGPGAPIRTAICNGTAVVFGFSVPQSFEEYDAASVVYPLPHQGDPIIGGHCVAITGYDYSRTVHPVPYFICDNSWSSGWGGSWGGSGCSGGRFALEASWFTPQYGLATDLWILSVVK